MGLYATQIFPRLMEWVMSGEEFCFQDAQCLCGKIRERPGFEDVGGCDAIRQGGFMSDDFEDVVKDGMLIDACIQRKRRVWSARFIRHLVKSLLCFR